MYFEWPEEDKKVGQLTGVSPWVGGCFQGDGFYNRVPHSDTPPPGGCKDDLQEHRKA